MKISESDDAPCRTTNGSNECRVLTCVFSSLPLTYRELSALLKPNLSRLYMNHSIQAFIFDVFGTTADWRSSVIAELKAAEQKYGLEQGATDWHKFAQLWRNGYMQTTRRIASGESGPSSVDIMHRQLLDGLLETPEFAHAGAAWDDTARKDINLAWHRLKGWPDTLEALNKLKKYATIAALSNGNMRLLIDMAKHADLPWDVIFSTELFDTFKPNPSAYTSTMKHLDLPPENCVMVTAHLWDLRGAAAQGMSTIYVCRPNEDYDENGVDISNSVKSKAYGGEADVVVTSFADLVHLVEDMRQ